jgi:ArsR family transcriptional regulator
LSSDALLTALRAAAEPTRLRILVLLARGELTVSELTRILEQSQPRVSRHLKLMCEAGLLGRTQEGSWAFYRIADEGVGARTAAALAALVEHEEAGDARDLERLAVIRAEHVEDAAGYFRENAAKWDAIRSLYVASDAVEEALLDAVGDVARDLLDVGTGTGQILRLLGRRVSRGLGVDASREMLAVARANLESANLFHCRVRQGDIHALPVEDACMDVVTIHHVLHFLDDPAAVVREAARTLRPGGRLLVVDFAPHAVESLRTSHAHRRLGFASDEVTAWCETAGLAVAGVQRFDAAARIGAEPLTVCLWTATREDTSS